MIRRVETEQQVLVLTFDDGPDNQYTPAVMEILKHYEAPGLFFCIGSHVEKHPEVVRQMVEAGHIIGNHTYSHPYLTKVTQEEVVQQLASTSSLIQDAVGLRPRFMRPPFGDVNEQVNQQITELGYETVLWDIDSVDWSGIPGPQIAANVLSRLRSGAVILHHSAYNVAGTVDALPYIIEVAMKMGYQFGRLDGLLGVSAYM